jgi:hypothetical protein
MTQFDNSADRRDELAADRDEAAGHRDFAASERDQAADIREAEADTCADDAHRQAAELGERLAGVRQQIVDRLRRVENATVDEAAWPDLTEDGLARLRAYTAEQRRVAALDRAAISRLLDDLCAEVQDDRVDRSQAARNRVAAARDRRAAGEDRQASARDRDDAARDRAQAAIERQQADPPDAGEASAIEVVYTGLDQSLIDTTARVIADSRKLIAESRARLRGTSEAPDPSARTTGDADAADRTHATS